MTIDAAANRHAISPNIYGVAYGDGTTLPDLNCPINRYGGNNTSRYNWLLNADNRGQDWYFESIGDSSATAGERGDTFFSVSHAAGAQAMLTVPMIGWVGKLGANRNKLSSFSIAKYGAQTGNDWQWFPDAGDGILASNGQNVTGNDPNDADVPADSTFQQAWVQHLVTAWGKSVNGGVVYYILDNEHSIWFATHRDVHPIGPTMDEINTKIVDYSAKIKAVDPTAQVVGPEEWGWSGYFYSGYDQQWGSQHGWSNLPDRANHGGQDYMPWLLAQLKQSAANTGQRPLDVFSAHYYPQGGEFGNDTSTAMQLRRNRSTRSLWDPNYVDESWINDKVQLIPRLKNWVSAYYFADAPVAITEYNWGAEPHINGATTQADILGIFGREGLDLATRWTTPDPSTPTYKAIKMYRNYDGSKSGFGDTSVSAAVANPDNLSAFAAVRSSDGALTAMVISKVLSGSTPVTVALNNFTGSGAAQVYQLTAANVIQHLADIAYSGTSAGITVPAQSITLLILPKSAAASPLLSITKTHSGSFTQGQQNAAYTVTVSNASGAGATTGTVTVTETAPSGLSLMSMSGTGWTCGSTSCTRSDALNGGGSYPAITVKVNVASNATSPQVNQVSVSGSGFATANASDSTVITSSNLPPTAVSVTPSSGSGSSQTFSFVFSDPNGFADLATAYIGFSSTFAFGNACYSYYDRNANALFLLNDAANAWLGPITPGAAATLQNSQCTLNGAGSSVSGSGNNLTVNLALTFKAVFGGGKNIYMCALDNGGLSSNWQQLGTWTVPAAGNLPPSTVSVAPSSGSGSSQTFGFVFSDPNGFADLSATYLGFSSTFAFGNECYSYYDRNANALWLLNDAASAWLGPITPQAAGTLQNSQCTLNAAGSSVSGVGNNLTVNVALTFKSAFGGAKNIYMCALDNGGLSSNWQQRGTWTVPNPNNHPPTTVSVTPSSGSGSSQTFGFVFSDPDGFTDLATNYIGFSPTFDFANACYSYYDRNANALWLLNDAANAWLGPITPGAGTLQNSQCTLNGAGSSVSGSGNNLTVNVALTFKAPFAGPKNVYLCALDNSGASSAWQQRGAWTAQ